MGTSFSGGFRSSRNAFGGRVRAPSFFLPLHEARQVLCHGGLRLSLGLCNCGTSVGGGIHGFDRRGKKDFRLQDKGSSSPLEPKWWPKWILIKSQDKRPPAVNALAQYEYTGVY